MPRATAVLRNARKVLEDLNLLKVLQSEISHELSSNPFQERGALGAFAVDWDSAQSQDVVLRRKSESGEEVAISALLGQETFSENSTLPREVLMKICIKKPGLSSILQFDCGICEKGAHGSAFIIHSAHYLQSPTSLCSSVYKGPPFGQLDPELQDALKEYLLARGIGKSLTNFLLFHLHQKEHKQYVNWLRKLESFVGREG